MSAPVPAGANDIGGGSLPNPALLRGTALRLPAPLFLLAPAALVATIVAAPLVYLVLRAGGASGALDLLLRSSTLEILGRTALLVVTVTALSAAVALPLAWLTVRTDLPLRALWTIVTVAPLAIPSYVGGLAIVGLLGPRGLLQQLLAPLGVERLPEIYGFPGAVLALTLFTYPYLLLTVRAALLGMDPSLEEASRGLGRSAWATFLRVTLPQLRPAIAAGALLVALYTLSDFGAVSLLRFDSFTRVIYVQYQSSFDRSVAAVLSLALVMVAAAVLALEIYARGRSRLYRTGAGAARQLRPLRLGRWRWPAVGLAATVTALALAMPLTVLLFWLARGAAAGQPVQPAWSAAGNSALASGLGTLAALAAALPFAFLAVRFPSLLSAALERISYVGFALPGIVVALALVFFGANLVPPLYQTLFMLVLAYVILFLPQAVGSTRTSLLQVSPSLEEAGRSLGHGGAFVLLTITAPLLRPGLLAGAALVFLTAMKELPATLLLGPTGFNTLATTIWAATAEGFFARAATPALMLVVVAAVPVAVLLWRERRA